MPYIIFKCHVPSSYVISMVIIYTIPYMKLIKLYNNLSCHVLNEACLYSIDVKIIITTSV